MTEQETRWLDSMIDVIRQDCINAFEKSGEIRIDVDKTGLGTFIDKGQQRHYDTGSRKITIVINCPQEIIFE